MSEPWDPYWLAKAEEYFNAGQQELSMYVLLVNHRLAKDSASGRMTGWCAPKDQYATPVMFNPYTGEPRDVRDVHSDPQGVLIVPPGKVHMLSAR